MGRVGLGQTLYADDEIEHWASEVSGLAALDVTALRQRWAEVFGEARRAASRGRCCSAR